MIGPPKPPEEWLAAMRGEAAKEESGEEFIKRIEQVFRDSMGDQEFEHSLRSQAAISVARNESARSVGIVYGTTLETTLELAIRRHMSMTPKLQERASNLFRPSGPLGTFSTRIDLGALMGIYSETVWRELVAIKDIRNDFAHRFEANSFEEPRIAGLVGNLRYIEQFTMRGDDMFYIRHRSFGTEVEARLGHRENPIATLQGRFTRTCEFYDHGVRASRPGQPHPDLHGAPPAKSAS